MKEFVKSILILILLPVCSLFSWTVASASDSEKPRAEVLKLAESAYNCAIKSGTAKPKTLTVIDYSLPSTAKRMWVIDMQKKHTLFHTLVSHGKGSGEKSATYFSNKSGSHATSLGLYKTEATYHGKNGYSLRLEGLDKGYNDNAKSRAVVIHGAPYVNDKTAKVGRVGRSWGCPAVASELAAPIINTIKEGDLVFAYYPDQKWMKDSKFLNCSA
ncbi:MAG: hypothetical protein K0Q74_723 [Gammaproteobacteria bacterium]|jgi:hypothetical protein|nr:hypothetical protein [Gammaproteobacteria bacterium]